MNTLSRLAALDYYTEGPAMDAEGNIYFTTLAGGAVMKLDKTGELTTWAKSNLPNGQIILPNGDHLVCDSALGKVLRFSPKGEFLRDETNATIADRKVQVPNDLAIDSQGSLYFTDSVRHDGAVYRIDADGHETILAERLDYPNGLVLTVDEKTLFVAESYGNRIIRINLKSLRSELFAKLPVNPSGEATGNLPDGIALNASGLMAVAHYGMQCVQLLSPNGELIASYDTSMPCTSNVFFADERTLIVTGGYGEPGPGAVFMLTI